MTKAKNSVSGATLSAHFPDAQEAERVKRAAARQGMKPSAFMRQAAAEAAARVLAEERCPECGRKHDAA